MKTTLTFFQKHPSVAIFLWLICALSIFFSGHLYSKDDLTKLESARSLIRHGTFAVDESTGAWGIRGKGDRVFPHFSIGSVLVCVPAAAVYEAVGLVRGKNAPRFFLSVLLCGMNLVCTALIGTLIFLVLMSFGTTKRRAFLFANAVIFGTEIFAYSSSGWSEPAALLCAITGFFFLVKKSGEAASGSDLMRRWIIWGMCAGAASLIRIEFIVFFIAFCVIGAIRDLRSWKPRLVALIVLGCIACVNLWYNQYRFGSLMDFGYFGRPEVAMGAKVSAGAGIAHLANHAQAGNFFWNFYVLFLSFGKVHWFWACPLAVMTPFILLFRKRVPAMVLHGFFAALIMMLLYARLGINTWCWANRYLCVVVPFLILPLAWIPREKKSLVRAAILMTAVGFVISFFGTIVNFHLALEKLVDTIGYHETMIVNAQSISGAMIWRHIELFPSQALATIRLVILSGSASQWEVLRSTCLNIWPVGLCAAKVPPVVAFGSWCILIVVTMGFGIQFKKKFR